MEITPVRTYRTGSSWGVAFDRTAYFVYGRLPGEDWSKHCGPYSTFDQARDWILAVREA